MNWRFLLLFSSALTFSACSLAPDYQPPTAPEPTAFKETGNWLPAAPADTLDRGAWWHMFKDPELDALEAKLITANQSLKIALAQYDQAHGAAMIARAAWYPTINGTADATHDKASKNVANSRGNRQYNDYTLGADLNYEIDLWGRVRNTVAANEDRAQASAADVVTVLLSLQAELASDYIALRGADVAQNVLDKTVEDEQAALDLTQRRYKGGVTAEVDVDQAITQVENAKSQAASNRVQRAQLEHAIAILVGEAPAQFTLAPAPLDLTLPVLSPGMPSVLLERRPDIASAERRVAAANAEIGVARAAWFPSISLTGNIGFESANTGSLFGFPSSFWAFGPQAAITLLDFGALQGLNEEARAAYDESVATYRQSVLIGYQEVEDNLAALHHLSDAQASQTTAAKAADRALMQANNRYTGGAVTYIDVVIAQNQALQAKLDSVTIAVRQLTASVQLIKALGGGWDRGALAEMPGTDLPTKTMPQAEETHSAKD